jgi:4-azaleucine resistance transporter AzlC
LRRSDSPRLTYARAVWPEHPSTREGLRAGLILVPVSILVGVSFGVVAEPVIGAGASIAMSALVYAGAAQFAAVAVLAAGGGAAPAVIAGVLLNARYLTMGVALAPSLRGGALRRFALAQFNVDASWAMANRGEGRFDVRVLVASSAVTYPCWVIGTALGVFAGELLGDPEALGLDVIFPAFFLGLVAGELRDRVAVGAALLGAAIALALVPFAPAGVPVLAASAAALLGLRRR